MLESTKLFELTTKHLRLWARTLKLIGAVVPYWTATWIVLLVIQGMIPAVTVYLTKLTIDSFVAVRNDLSLVNDAIFLLIATGATLLLGEALQSLIAWTRTSQEDILTNHLKDLIHEKAAEVDISFYESPSYFDLLEQVRGNSISRPLALLESFGSVVQSLITLLSFSAILLSYGWWVPLILLVGALPALAVYVRSERIMQNWTKETTQDRRWLSYFDSVLTTTYTAQETRVYALSDHFRKRYQDLSKRLRLEKIGHVKKQLAGKFFAGILALAAAGFGVGWIALKVLNNTATLGDLAIFYQVFSRGQSLMQSLLSGVNRTFSNNFYLDILFEFLDLKPGIRSTQTPVPFPSRLKIGIEFSNVTFTYPSARQPSLQNFDLFIPAGKIVAIVGANGAGKSTMIKLLCRFYEPDEGTIRIDGIDIRDFDISELRKGLAVYFQFPVHYHETVAQNIAFGDIQRPATEGEIREAAESAGADQFIEKLAQQYESMLGKHFTNGAELSGGQWQRLTLARAYYRKAPILILDEPTSFMDSWSEAEWFEHLRDLLTDRTGLIITHRFTIAMRGDIIHVMDEGRIIESGTHKDLVVNGGSYAESWASQTAASM